MPTRLRELKIQRVDLVDAGANPKAYVKLTKRRVPAAKMAPTFDEALMARRMWQVENDLYDMQWSLEDTIRGALYDPEPNDKTTAIGAAVDAYAAKVKETVATWMGEAIAKRAVSTPEQLARLQKRAVQLATLITQAGGASMPKPIVKEKPSLDGVPDDVKAYITQLEEAAAAAKAAEKAKSPEPAIPEDLLKGLPEPARKALEESQAQAKAAGEKIAGLEKREAERAEADALAKCVSRAAVLKRLPIKADDLGGWLRALEKANPKYAEDLMVRLKAADEALALASVLTDAIGRDGGQGTGEETAEAELLRKAHELVSKSADGKLTLGDAIKKISKTEPALYARYQTEKRGRSLRVGSAQGSGSQD